MQVTVRCYGALRAYAGAREVQVTLAEGAAVSELAHALQTQLAQAAGSSARVRIVFNQMRVLVNGRDLFTLKGQDTVLVDGDTVTLLPFMTGG
jgi:molybdopterin converting factor small subunit